MMENDSQVDELVRDILEEKLSLEMQGKNPRIILLDELSYKMLEEDWLKDYKDMPFGDSLEYELKNNKVCRSMFLADASIFGLWVVKVDTIEGFEVK